MEPQEEHNEAEKGKRNMEKLFDLQVFAQENTQTTGGLSAEMKTYYGMELLDNAKPQLVHNQFAATKPLPTGGGKKMCIRDRDYDTDGMYWAFYINGEYAQTGVDATGVEDGAVYAFRAGK